MSKPVATIPQLADYLVNGFWQDNGEIAHHWGSTTITYNISGLNAAEKTLAQAAIQAWQDVTNLTFVLTTGSANITYNHNGSMTAFENDSYTGGGITTSATVDISADWVTTDGGANDGKTGIDSYAYQTYIHETGHALGLGHQGNYNGGASYSSGATYADDTWQYSVMSYFSQSNYNGSSYRYVITPQMADIYAVQSIYGAPTTTRSGDTVYGFHNTAGSIYNFSNYTQAPALTIYDSGGNDTLDCSGYSVAQTIDLHAGSFSSVGGLVHNIGIATSATIECAIGGSGNDTLIANDGGCTLNGGAGNDTLTGGAGNDIFDGGSGNNTITGGAGTNTLDYSSHSGAQSVNVATGTAQNGLGGTDTFTGIQHFIFGAGDDTFTGDGGNYIVDLGAGNNTINGSSGVDTIDYSTHAGQQTINVFTGTAQNGSGGTDHFSNIAQFYLGSGDDTVYGGPGNHLFMGGAGNNTISYVNATSPVIIDLSLGSVQNGFGGVDHMGSFEFFYGGQADDTLLGGPGQVFLDGGGGWNIVDYTHAPGSVTFDMLHGYFHNGFGGLDHLGNFEVFKGSPNDDLFVGPPGSIYMDGGAGTDTLDYTAQPGAATVNLSTGIAQNGFGGTDHISNFEIVKTGAGNDTLIGQSGASTFFGGAGDNTFVFRDGFGTTTIGDFTASTTNVLDLSGVAAFHTFADVEAHWSQVGSDVHIDNPAGGAVVIDNVTTAYLQAHQSEFIV